MMTGSPPGGGAARRIGLLLFASCALAAALEFMHVPAGLLLGPMAAAIVFAGRGGVLRLPPFLSVAGQAGVGLLIAPSLNLSVLATAAREPWIFIGGTVATLGASIGIGWLLARLRVLPGSVAIWGSMPGAATAMVFMAKDEGADWQLVAVLTYLRVIFVAALSSLLAAVVAGHAGGAPPGGAWFPPLDALLLAETVAIGAAGAWGGAKLKLPAAALLGPMILGTLLEAAGLAHPQLPGWLLATSYLLVGWRIGLGFTPEIIATARRAAPRLGAAIVGLVLLCAAFGVLLSRLAGKSLITAYLAMSPGGADSVAIIANSIHVDVPFVMSMQVIRFVTVLLIGPALARAVARRFAPADQGGDRGQAT